ARAVDHKKVVARPAVHDVRSHFSVKAVVARSSEKRVVTSATTQIIVSSTAVEYVGRGRAVDEIVFLLACQVFDGERVVESAVVENDRRDLRLSRIEVFFDQKHIASARDPDAKRV